MTSNFSEKENLVTYRQSWNLWSKNWSLPKKRLDSTGDWVPVNKENLHAIVTKKDGYAFALWRLRDIMIKLKDEHGRPVWKVMSISKEKVVHKGITYSVFQFDCHRIAHGIIGGMNTMGGAK